MTKPQDPYLIVSADSHAGLPTEQYRSYLDARYHRDFDDFIAERIAEIARRCCDGRKRIPVNSMNDRFSVA